MEGGHFVHGRHRRAAAGHEVRVLLLWPVNTSGPDNVQASSSGITRIPDDIADLAGIVVVSNTHGRDHSRVQGQLQDPIARLRKFSRVQTAPASFRAAKNAQTDGVELFLAQNDLTSLPLALFKLQNLTLLSLRNNKLEKIPPQIAELRALRVLNVASNKLSYLPAEMLSMTLSSLVVHPNNFLRDPTGPTSATLSSPWRAVGPIMPTMSATPPLGELIVRFLLSPHASPSLFSPSHSPSLHPAPAIHIHSPSRPQPHHSPHTSPIRQRTLARTATPSNLSTHFMLPLTDEHSIPERYARILALCQPGTVAAPPKFGRTESTASWTTDSDATMVNTAATGPEDAGLSRCPSTKHLLGGVEHASPPDWTATKAWTEGPPYVQHAEERYMWVDVVAGVRVGQVDGGVPLLWRGCERGCLDILGEAGPQDVDGDVEMAG
ncbi:hypothetical protein OF83DRAFT_694755 [Amylostereum chailletii]|nr:hypothetical protein OF83DRAFT_694755 [Amylostereum chailletii]